MGPMVPRIVHQTWRSTELPGRFRESADSWRRHHPGWEYRLWTDADLDDLVRRTRPDLLPLWRAYPDQIQRVDAARYLMLHRFGGLYADLDVECLRPFDDLLDRPTLAPTEPVGVSNDLMLMPPGHPLMALALARLPDAFARWQRPWIPRHLRVMATTGPLFLTGTLRALRGSGARAGAADPVRLMDPAEYGAGDESGARVAHHPGDTWAGADTRALGWAWRNRRWLVGGALAAALATAWRYGGRR